MRLALKLLNDAIRDNGAEIEWVPGYSEPGYGPAELGVYLANWNPKSFRRGCKGESGYQPEVPTFESRAGELLERLGADLEWSDEWSTCGDCGNAVRTSPDGYSWTPSYVLLNECELVCSECLSDDPEALAEHLEGSTDRADTFGVDWSLHGWRLLPEEYVSGFHPGQDDDPKVIAAALRERGVDRFLFQIDANGQFETCFRVWVRDND